MRTLKLLLLAGFCHGFILLGRAQQPTPLLTQPPEKLIATLKSDASLKEKVDACRQLAVIGNKDAIAALAALLPNEQLNHMARYALETIPDPAVDQALREALSTLKGRPLVGVIGSLGVRKDAEAVPLLASLLEGADPEASQAAARSLGQIANPAAVAALRRALPASAGPNQAAVCEGLLRCAEALSAKNNRTQAAVIYDELRQLQGPHQVRAAAVRGAIITRGTDGVALLREALRSSDPIVFAAAIRAAYELPGVEIGDALASVLPQLSSEDHKLLVIQALGKRAPSDQPRTALANAAQSGPKSLRLAAVRALGEWHVPAILPIVQSLLTDPDRELAQAALESFAAVPGSEADKAVRALLTDENAARRAAGVELAGRRRLTACLPELVRAANDSDPQVRSVAIGQVGELGGSAELSTLLELLQTPQSPQSLDALEQALITIAGKTGASENPAAKIAKAFPAVPPAQKGVLLRVMSALGGREALDVVRAAAKDADPEVHGAAIRALGTWKTAEAAPDLLALARSSAEPADQTLCLRSYLGLAANLDLPGDQRLALCRQVADLPKAAEEKKMLLSALSQIVSPEAVRLIEPFLDDPATKEEASMAVASIAEKMLKEKRPDSTTELLVASLKKAARATENETLSKRVNSLLQQAGQTAQP